MRAARRCVLVALLFASAAGLGRTSADTSLRITYWEDSAIASTSVTWTLRCDPARGSLDRPARACAGSRRVARSSSPHSRARRVHRDLRRPTESARRRHGRRQARLVDLHADERLRDRPLAAHLALARASRRRHELTTSLVTIGGREDRPLRRRRTPSAPRDRAGPRARPARRSRRSQCRRPGLTSADVAEVVDFSDVDAVVEVARQDRRRRRAHGLRRSRRARRGRSRRGARPSRHRDADGPPPDAQARDA